MIFNPIKRAGVILLPAITALALTGCWTPHNANVQPAGEPRLIQGGIPVDAVKNHATVEAIAAGQRRISLKLSDGTLVSCPVGPQVKDLAQVQAGDKVKVTLAQELTVYVLKDGRLADAVIPGNAKVQFVDQSYRLLTLQYPDGHTEELKTGLETKLSEMAPGDVVVIKTTEAKAIHVEKK